jgi:hypothetical protein
MPKLTLHDMPRVAQAQMLAALRRAHYGSLLAGMAFCPQEPHRLGGRSRRPNAHGAPTGPDGTPPAGTSPPPHQLQRRGEGASRVATSTDYETSPPGLLAIIHNTQSISEHAE